MADQQASGQQVQEIPIGFDYQYVTTGGEVLTANSYLGSLEIALMELVGTKGLKLGRRGICHLFYGGEKDHDFEETEGILSEFLAQFEDKTKLICVVAYIPSATQGNPNKHYMFEYARERLGREGITPAKIDDCEVYDRKFNGGRSYRKEQIKQKNMILRPEKLIIQYINMRDNWMNNLDCIVDLAGLAQNIWSGAS